MQTSYEVVRRAIEFATPERLPLRINTDPLSDTVNVDWNYIGPGNYSSATTRDEWNCLWVRSEEENMGQIKGHPLDDWGNLSSFKWPNPDDSAFYAGMQERLDQYEDKYMMCDIFMLLFERLQALRGFKNLMLDFYLEGEKIEALADRITEFDLAIISNLSSRFGDQFHGFWFTDDWGTQQSLMINPELWRSFFKPRYAKIFQAIHAAGWHVWMHTDGLINEIIPDLIQIGVNVLNLMSPRINGIEEIGSKYAGTVCFETSVDLQLSLPHNNPEQIQREAAMLLKHWSTPLGGFILSIDDGDQKALKIPVESRQTMLDAFLELDPWRRVAL